MKALGVSKGRLGNQYVKASSEWDRYHAAYLARLNLKPRGRFKGGWSAKKNNRKQWIQFDFKRPVYISKIATQGRSDANQYVTSFAVAYSPDGYRWTPFKINGRLKVMSHKVHWKWGGLKKYGHTNRLSVRQSEKKIHSRSDSQVDGKTIRKLVKQSVS